MYSKVNDLDIKSAQCLHIHTCVFLYMQCNEIDMLCIYIYYIQCIYIIYNVYTYNMHRLVVVHIVQKQICLSPPILKFLPVQRCNLPNLQEPNLLTGYCKGLESSTPNWPANSLSFSWLIMIYDDLVNNCPVLWGILVSLWQKNAVYQPPNDFSFISLATNNKIPTVELYLLPHSKLTRHSASKTKSPAITFKISSLQQALAPSNKWCSSPKSLLN